MGIEVKSRLLDQLEMELMSLFMGLGLVEKVGDVYVLRGETQDYELRIIATPRPRLKESPTTLL